MKIKLRIFDVCHLLFHLFTLLTVFNLLCYSLSFYCTKNTQNLFHFYLFNNIAIAMQPKKLGRGRPKKQKRERLDEESNIVIQPRKMGRTKKQKRKVGRPKKQKTENMDEDGNPSHSESTTNNNNQVNFIFFLKKKKHELG